MYGNDLSSRSRTLKGGRWRLHEVLLEVQRLDLAGRHDRLDRLEARGHLLDPLPCVARAGLEVRAHARSQRLRLADVENVAAFVPQDVGGGDLSTGA